MSEPQEILHRLQAISDDPCAYLSGWKQHHDRKIIGCVPMHFPEEIIHAAGMLPVAVPESEEAITLGHAHIHSYICGYVRSSIDIALKGKLSFLNGWVFADTCHSVRGMTGIIKANVATPYYKPLFLPAVLNSRLSRDLLLSEFDCFRADLEKYSGDSISDKAITASIAVYNANRNLLRRLYNLRRVRPGILSARQTQAVVAAGMYMPKEEHSEILEKLLTGLETSKEAKDDRIRLVISGSLCEPVDGKLLDLIEESGAVVIDDDLYFGSRYFLTDAEPADKPLDALASRYLNMVAPCPTRVNTDRDLGDYLVQMARNAKAQGVINIVVKFCEPHAFYYPQIKKKLADAGIPELMLETDHDEASLGQYRTRLEAFLEMIR